MGIKGDFVEIRVEGKTLKVPSIEIDGRRIVASGKWLRIAALQDEELVEGETVKDPEALLRTLRQARFGADILTFAQPLTDTKPKHELYFEWDNAAIIPTTDFKGWWEGLSQDTRRNVKKASKAGVSVQTVAYDDKLVQGIVDIYNETPVRQGRRFWHYGKSFDVIKNETATYLDRSEFLGAYFQGELIGFIKMVYVNQSAHILHILSKEKHSDKRPTNALIAKAVEICADKGLSYFVYCKYVYGKNDDNSLTEFKRRNGFEQLRYPRYYVPLTSKGKLVLQMNLHRGIVNLLPKSVFAAVRALRRKSFEIFDRKGLSEAQAR